MLNIGLAVYDILNNDEELNTVIGNRIYPVAVPNFDSDKVNVSYPFLTFTRSTINIQYTKDSISNDVVTVNIDIWAKDYKQAIEIAMRVRNLLESIKGKFNGVDIQDSELTSAFEAFDTPNFFGQILTFAFM